MLHNRQAPGRDFHQHFSLAPARSDTITASSKTSATAATRNPPPHPDPYKTGPKLAKRHRGHHTCHSSLSLPPPPHPACAPLAPLPPSRPPSTRGREGHRQVSSWDARERPHLKPQRHPPLPLRPLHLQQASPRATHKRARGAQAGVVAGNKGHPSSQSTTPPTPDPPALPSPV